ncbi:hypothetical protein DY000_02037222 [Brassica cretica]|uniref:Uncharacterized protein n=1 Tax=Brassica cretica TaxID=69181 RepID=A0ABQ7BNK6_BRACR|nr:hypothetical protein DY000_02037222 [Brassica cretica]
MSHQYSRADKGKWQAEQRHPKKLLVKIPDSDVSDLIDRNRFTLIGRMYRTIKSTEKPTTSSDIGQSDTCENELKVNSERHARDLQGLWSNSSSEARFHLKAKASGLDMSSNKNVDQRCPSYERLSSDSSSLTGTRPEIETPNLEFTLAIPNLPP